jgi:hypothetical protein
MVVSFEQLSTIHTAMSKETFGSLRIGDTWDETLTEGLRNMKHVSEGVPSRFQ